MEGEVPLSPARKAKKELGGWWSCHYGEPTKAHASTGNGEINPFEATQSWAPVVGRTPTSRGRLCGAASPLGGGLHEVHKARDSSWKGVRYSIGSCRSPAAPHAKLD